MARKRVTISFSSIIWMAVMGYIFFGGDDNDSKEIEVSDQDKPAIVEQTNEDTKINVIAIKDKVFELVDKAQDEVNEALELSPNSKPTPEPEEPPKKERTMVAEPEKPAEELKPIINKSKSEGMKKL